MRLVRYAVLRATLAADQRRGLDVDRSGAGITVLVSITIRPYKNLNNLLQKRLIHDLVK